MSSNLPQGDPEGGNKEGKEEADVQWLRTVLHADAAANAGEIISCFAIRNKCLFCRNPIKGIATTAGQQIPLRDHAA